MICAGSRLKTVLVSGAAGGVGEGIVRALLDGGQARVIATSRSAGRLAELLARLDPQLRSFVTPIVADAGDFIGAATIAERVASLGGVDAAVAILGRGWWTNGPLLDLSPQTWTSILNEMLTAHFAFARAVIPLLATRAKSVYLSIGGGAAFEPVLDAGLVSIAAAGQLMLTRTLAGEHQAASPRICELVVNGPVNTRESRHFAQPNWMTASDVGRVVAEIIFCGQTTWSETRTTGPLLIMSELRGNGPSVDR
jgi:NAD(P)-dependent dehydrogenase (short-subunit alcohol dehydrogenase family)